MSTVREREATVRAPSAWRLGLARGGVELREYWREPEAVFFTFAMPAVLLVLLGSLFNGTEEIPGGAVLTASMLAAGVASATFVNLGIGIAIDRDDGTLRRLRGVPMPPVAYFLGKIIQVMVISLGSAVVLLSVGASLFGLPLPSDPGRWLTLGWVFLLGCAACALLGIAASSLARTARSAGAVMNLPYLVLLFISGVFFLPVHAIPTPLITVGALFPMKWLAQGFRAALLPDELQVLEHAGAWEHGRVAMVLLAWCIGGMVLCLTTFRWRGRRDG